MKLKRRKQIYSITLDPDLVQELYEKSDKEMNFSKLIGELIKKYIEIIEQRNQK